MSKEIDKLIEQVLAEKDLSNLPDFDFTLATPPTGAGGLNKLKIALEAMGGKELVSLFNDLAPTAGRVRTLDFNDLQFQMSGDKVQSSRAPHNDKVVRLLATVAFGDLKPIEDDLAAYINLTSDEVKAAAKDRLEQLATISLGYRYVQDGIDDYNDAGLSNWITNLQPSVKNIDADQPDATGLRDRFKAREPEDFAPQTITDPSMASAGSSEGKYRGELLKIFENFLEGDGRKWVEGLKKISDFSKQVAGESDAEEYTGDKPTDFFTDLMVLEYVNKFVREMEGGGGAYLFEAFLGLLAQGYVGGKEMGIAGGPGEADFVYQWKDDNGKLKTGLGSAKYYKSDSASQSAQSFAKGESVGYCYAMKIAKKGDASGKDITQKTGDEGASVSRGLKRGTEFTSDAEEITSLAMYTFSIMKVSTTGGKAAAADADASDTKVEPLNEGSGGEAKRVATGEKPGPGRAIFKFEALKPDGNNVSLGLYSCPINGQIALKPGLVKESLTGIIELPYTPQNSLRDATDSFVENLNNKLDTVKQAYGFFKELFTNLVDAKKQATLYSTINPQKETDKSLAAGNATIDRLVSADSAMASLVPLITGKGAKVRGNRKPKDPSDKRRIVQKESKSPLDQLIEIIIKQTLLK
jgi:hypothetical protein